MKLPKPHLIALSILLASGFLAMSAAGAEFWVSPNGTDLNPGTSAKPFASIPRALQRARELRRQEKTASERIEIILRGGVYQLKTELHLDPQDSGSSTNPLVIAAAPGEHPVLSGAVELRGWKPAGPLPGLPKNARGNVWVASVPGIGGGFLNFRQLWVNGSKAVRAREPNEGTMRRLIAWDKTNQIATIPGSALSGVKSPALVEMIIDQVWEIAVLRLKSIQSENTNALIAFQQPESRLEFQHPWPPVIVNAKYQAPFFLANALEFLDSPGEWFEDLRAGKVYYWPRSGEVLAHAAVCAPAIERLVSIEGSSNQPAANIQFNGLTFAYTTWLRPSQEGHVALQEGMPLLDAKRLSPKGTPYHRALDNVAWIGRPPGAVSLKNARHVSFENCVFEHLASAGLDFQGGTHDDLVQGCIFHEIGGNGIQMGTFSDANVETHVPFNSSDDSIICSREQISNNVFSDCGDEDWGCVGIGIGYAREISVEHNEVFNMPYTGISVGWGWTRATNCMRGNFIFANHVHHVGQKLNDLGGIYTLSAQPGTVVAENCISDIQPGPDVPDPNHWYYLYLDEGSSFITVRDNWCPAEKFLKNANGPGNIWTNNGPQVSGQIKDAAGLKPAFKGLLQQMRN